jgi:hypothetical protein
MRDHCQTDRLRTRHRIPLLSALCSALALAACAPSPAQIEANREPAQANATLPPERAETRLCRPDPALLSPQPAPDCAFRRKALKTMDPDQWARLKVEYERQCFRDAERAVRERLRLLQTANRCEMAER